MYEAVIGLEVHAQLKTKTKAFCGCMTGFGKEANTQTCPVCLGFPGSLPVLNEKALEYGIKVGLALHCQIQKFTKFDRKNYFYPDLPKGYQISQYGLPLALQGFLTIELKEKKKSIGIRRAHLEEDAGKLIHQEGCSLVDYNRAGIPLLEIVSEPDISSPEEAYEYLTSLKSILKYLEVCDCDMEKGSLRCDANISLRKHGVQELGTKAELKNLNSFKAVRDSLTYEIKRQTESLEAQKPILQETRLWDEVAGKTVSMRSKEEAMDYRYFPEPDLPPLTIQDSVIKALRDSLPELPEALKKRFVSDYGLSAYDAGILAAEKAFAKFFEDTVKFYPKAKIVCNWCIGPLSYELNARNSSIESLLFTPQALSSLLQFVEEGKLNNLAAKEVLAQMCNSGKPVEVIVKEKDLLQVSDIQELEGIVDRVIAENAKSVGDYTSGKGNAFMFLVGQVMKASKGKANPKVAQDVLREKLKVKNP